MLGQSTPATRYDSCLHQPRFRDEFRFAGPTRHARLVDIPAATPGDGGLPCPIAIPAQFDNVTCPDGDSMNRLAPRPAVFGLTRNRVAPIPNRSKRLTTPVGILRSRAPRAPTGGAK